MDLITVFFGTAESNIHVFKSFRALFVIFNLTHFKQLIMYLLLSALQFSISITLNIWYRSVLYSHKPLLDILVGHFM